MRRIVLTLAIVLLVAGSAEARGRRGCASGGCSGGHCGQPQFQPQLAQQWQPQFVQQAAFYPQPQWQPQQAAYAMQAQPQFYPVQQFQGSCANGQCGVGFGRRR